MRQLLLKRRNITTQGCIVSGKGLNPAGGGKQFRDSRINLRLESDKGLGDKRLRQESAFFLILPSIPGF